MPLSPQVVGNNLVYTIYTSGSRETNASAFCWGFLAPWALSVITASSLIPSPFMPLFLHPCRFSQVYCLMLLCLRMGLTCSSYTSCRTPCFPQCRLPESVTVQVGGEGARQQQVSHCSSMCQLLRPTESMGEHDANGAWSLLNLGTAQR